MHVLKVHILRDEGMNEVLSHFLPLFVSQNIYENNFTKVLTLNIKIQALQSIKTPKRAQI